TLTLPTPGAAGSLAANSDIAINSLIPGDTSDVDTPYGKVIMTTDDGGFPGNAIKYWDIADIQGADQPDTDFPFGIISFKITGLGPALPNTAIVTIEMPQDIPNGSRIWKAIEGTGTWQQVSGLTGGQWVDVTDLDLADGIEISGLDDGDNIFIMKISDNSIFDANGNPGTIEDPFAIIPSSGSGSSTCAGDCYSPHLGVDENGKVFYNDGLTINGQTFNVENILHNSPDTIINLPVGQPVNIQIKAMDSWANSIDHCELGVAIPHGIFDKNLAAFTVSVNREFDGSDVKYDVVGDKTALKDLYVSFENIDDKTALCTISFVPTKHLQNDMFSVEVWDSFQYTGTYYFNHGIIFKGESLVGTPVYDVMDDKGRITTIAITDQTLEDLTHAVDTKGNKWTLVDGFWKKDFVAPDKTCDSNEGRICIAFQDTIKQQQELARKYFDGSKIQKDAPKSFTKDLYGHQTGRGPHESSDQMKWAMEITKALRFLK
ncbi:MAG: choice-of-anchor U domain-containing protein, partial [Candidatus Nitrosotenuis sp.]